MTDRTIPPGFELDPATGHYRRRQPQPATPAPVTAGKAERKAEKVLQAEAENWLTLRGYLRLTAHNAQRLAELPDTICRGWFGHMVATEKNPQYPDLMIFDPALRRCLMIELKIPPPRYSDGQREFLDGGQWQEARSLETVAQLVSRWEDGWRIYGNG